MPAMRPGFNERIDAILRRPPPDGRESDSIEVQSWADATTTFLRLRDEPSDTLTATFDRCLEALNRFVRACGMASSDPRVVRIGKERLNPMILMQTFPAGDGPASSDRFSLMMLHHNFAADVAPDELDPHVVASIMTLQAKRAPFMKSKEWLARARHAGRIVGDYDDGTMKLEIAVETLLFATLRMALVDQGLDAATIDARIEAARPYQSLVTRFIPEQIGGSWDFAKAGSAVAVYREQLYRRRNRIVHGGTSMTSEDYRAAERAHDVLLEHLIECVLAQPRKLARTACALVGGEKGLRARGCWTKAMSALVADLMAEPTPFWWPRDLAGR